MKTVKVLKTVGKILVGTIFGAFLIWYAVSSLIPSKAQECDYTAVGCQGDNRWGQ